MRESLFSVVTRRDFLFGGELVGIGVFSPEAKPSGYVEEGG